MKNLKNYIYLFLALSLPTALQAMEEKQTNCTLSTLPEELKLAIASSIETKTFTETIKEVLNLRLVSKEWNNIAQDEQLIRFIIKKYKERDENNKLSYYAIFSTIYQAVLNEDNRDDRFRELVSLHQHGTFYSEFVQATQRRKLSLVKLILTHDPHLSTLENLTRDSQTALNQALYAATVNNDQEMVKLLIAHGAQVQSENIYMSSPIKIAIEKGFEEILRLLFSPRAQQSNFNDFAKRKLFSGALNAAMMSGNINIAEIIINESANIDLEITNSYGYSMLQIAIDNHDVDLVEKLLQKGVRVDQEDIDMSDKGRKRKRVDNGQKSRRKEKIAKLLTDNLNRVFIAYVDNKTDKHYVISVVDSDGNKIGSDQSVTENKTTLNLNLTVNSVGVYPTVVITGEGLPADGWRYAPSGQNHLLSFCIREINGTVVVEKQSTY